MDVIGRKANTSSRAGYLAIEEKLRNFAAQTGIDMDHLDLLLWSRKTGEILK
jgi:thermostable 8-oxoguanine DNA glycosylase